jgi:hypothetical protein
LLLQILASSKRKRKQSLPPAAATTASTANIDIINTATAIASTEVTAAAAVATTIKMTRKMIRAEKRAKLLQASDVTRGGDITAASDALTSAAIAPT